MPAGSTAARRRLPADPCQRRGGPAARPQLRHRLLRPRRDDVRRPVPTVPEVARLLRPGGLLAFSHGSAILDLIWADEAERAGETLVRDYFGLHRLESGDEIAFQLPYGEWIRLFRANGLEILDLIEPRPAPDATSTYRDEVERDWSRRWPAESIWRLRRRE